MSTPYCPVPGWPTPREVTKRFLINLQQHPAVKPAPDIQYYNNINYNQIASENPD